MHTKTKIVLYLLVLELFVFVKPAHAYLDPGTSSYLFQLLIAGVLSGSVFLGSASKRIRNFFKSITSRKDKTDDEKPE